jgi:hypothetical protein
VLTRAHLDPSSAPSTGALRCLTERRFRHAVRSTIPPRAVALGRTGVRHNARALDGRMLRAQDGDCNRDAARARHA